jgi:tetratricopeptide (TPR) repeat protein
MYKYDKRLYLYPDISGKLKLLQDKKDIQREIEAIIIQIIRSRETEKISRKLREEIIPEMVKLRPKLEDKLDLDKLVPEDPFEEKNPDWKIVFEESNDLYSKVEEFTQLQMEGADVFMTAFSQLKQFDFFREISNWFLPFYPENEIIDVSLSTEETTFDKDLFIEGLFQTSFLCNSDKYSFILNVKHMPQVQKTMMLELFNAELKGMNEIAGQDEILDKFKKTKSIYVQYLQDLYRFYKLFPYRYEFDDVFEGKLDIYNSTFFNLLLKDKSILRNIAEYLFEKEYYEEVLGIYLYLNDSEEKSYEILEKIGFCYQKLGKTEEALKYYLQGELFDKNRLWNLKKIALCYRKLEQPEKALEYYLEAEKLDPENLITQASIGHCYLDIEDYETALKYYFKVEYLDPKNKKVLRPIAWCYFVLGKLDQSRKYYSRLFENEVSIYDYINFGHVEWCLGNPLEAINLYKKSIIHEENNWDNFLITFNDDRHLLLKNGIISDDIPIVLDYLMYSLNART